MFDDDFQSIRCELLVLADINEKKTEKIGNFSINRVVISPEAFILH